MAKKEKEMNAKKCEGKCGTCGKCDVLKDTRINFVARSQNSKLGTMSATYASHNTCPATSCPFKKIELVDGEEEHGCYGETAFCAIHWKKVDKGESGGPYESLDEQMLKNGTMLLVRHNVVGDMCIPGTNDLSEEIIGKCVECYKKVKAFTYTHCEKSEKNFEKARKGIENGFAINFSCEKLEDVEKVVKAGLPAVLVVNTMKDKVVKKDGIVYMHCPNQEDGRKCNACQICMNTKRKVVIVFTVHSRDAKKARKAGFLTDL